MIEEKDEEMIQLPEKITKKLQKYCVYINGANELKQEILALLKPYFSDMNTERGVRGAIDIFYECKNGKVYFINYRTKDNNWHAHLVYEDGVMKSKVIKNEI